MRRNHVLSTLKLSYRQKFHDYYRKAHRGVKRVTRPMLGFKSFEAAQCTVAGIELMHMIKKGQMVVEAVAEGLTSAEQFYSLAA